jgi:glycosyltransferase involved in cell wall biosynthesis
MLVIENSIVAESILVLSAIFCVIQLYYILFQFSGVGFKKITKPQSGNSDPVSIIICARNELKNLRQFLPEILNQDYPQFQVVVVNDCSWDESSRYLEEMEDAHYNLKVITINEQEKYQHGKKFALTLGIKGAAYDRLIFTDADCYPSSNQWLKEMSSALSIDKEIVVGYGAYQKNSGFLNKWIRFDTAQNGLLYISRALKGKAYMGVGRNLGYVRSLFFKNKGFASHNHLLSGDDDLFVNETATKNNVAVSLSNESKTISKPKETFKDWLRQKRRHMSSGKYYKSSDKSLIGMYHFSHTVFLMLVIISLAFKLNWVFTLALILTRLIAQIIVYWTGFRKLGEKDLIILLPVFDLIAAIIYPLLAITNPFIKIRVWK